MAVALTMRAVAADMSVRFWQTAQLVLELGNAKRKGTLSKLLNDVSPARLLVLDEFVHVPCDVDGARVLYQVISVHVVLVGRGVVSSKTRPWRSRNFDIRCLACCRSSRASSRALVGDPHLDDVAARQHACQPLGVAAVVLAAAVGRGPVHLRDRPDDAAEAEGPQRAAAVDGTTIVARPTRELQGERPQCSTHIVCCARVARESATDAARCFPVTSSSG